jgi:hypothetical protein
MEHEDELIDPATATQPLLPSHMSETDLRFNCLSMAHNPAFEVDKVIERATKYLDFIKGATTASPASN